MAMYLVDTDVISEARNGDTGNPGHLGRLRVPNPQNPLDKQIAATALINDLTVVTCNTSHFVPTGVQVLNPFS